MHCASWVFPSFQFDWLVKDIKHNIPKELDFVHEAQNMEKFTKLFTNFSYIKVWSLQSLLDENYFYRLLLSIGI